MDIDDSLKNRLAELINQHEVMLFMKGDRFIPQCGFSAKVTEILDELEVQYETFDILIDDDVRNGLKIYSDWPTFPQLYHKGELVGGCDIISEMYENGELTDLFKKN